MKTVLVHGIWDTSRIFSSMIQLFTSEGHECFAPSLKPSDARHGIEDLAQKLRKEIAQDLAPDEKFVLVGFSMGCLISRVYLQHLGGIERCVEFHAISGPLNGSFLAHFYPGKGARDMRPNSKLLQSLNDKESILSTLPITSYRTPYDLMILPSKSSHWKIAKNIKTKCPIHALMVKDRTVQQSILSSLNHLDPSAPKRPNDESATELI